MPKTQQLLTTAQVASQLGVSVRTVHRLIDRDEISVHTKVPGLRGAYLFDADEVERIERKRTAA